MLYWPIPCNGQSPGSGSLVGDGVVCSVIRSPPDFSDEDAEARLLATGEGVCSVIATDLVQRLANEVLALLLHSMLLVREASAPRSAPFCCKPIAPAIIFELLTRLACTVLAKAAIFADSANNCVSRAVMPVPVLYEQGTNFFFISLFLFFSRNPSLC